MVFYIKEKMKFFQQLWQMIILEYEPRPIANTQLKLFELMNYMFKDDGVILYSILSMLMMDMLHFCSLQYSRHFFAQLLHSVHVKT